MSAKIERLEMAALAPAVQQALAARVKRLGYLGEFFKYAGYQPDVLPDRRRHGHAEPCR